MDGTLVPGPWRVPRDPVGCTAGDRARPLRKGGRGVRAPYEKAGEAYETATRIGSVQLCDRGGVRGPGGLRGCLVRRVGVAVLAPPRLTLGGEGVDRVVVDILGAGDVDVRGLDRGAVVLAPVGDPALGVVGVDLVHPALPHERHVADDAG